MPLIFQSPPLWARGLPPTHGSRLSHFSLTGGAHHRVLQPLLGLSKSQRPRAGGLAWSWARAGNGWTVFAV